MLCTLDGRRRLAGAECAGAKIGARRRHIFARALYALTVYRICMCSRVYAYVRLLRARARCMCDVAIVQMRYLSRATRLYSLAIHHSFAVVLLSDASHHFASLSLHFTSLPTRLDSTLVSSTSQDGL